MGQLGLGGVLGACVWMWLKRISRTPSLRDWSFGELLSARTWKRRMSGAILAAMVSWEMVRAEARSRKGVRRRMGRMWKIGNGKKIGRVFFHRALGAPFLDFWVAIADLGRES